MYGIPHAPTPPPGFRNNAGFTENRIEKPISSCTYHLKGWFGFAECDVNRVQWLRSQKRKEDCRRERVQVVSFTLVGWGVGGGSE
jgi:hypothetical protein